MKVVYRKENLIIVDNFFDDFDIDSSNYFLKDLYRRKYDFPDMHKHYIIDQYEATDEVIEYGKLAVDKVKSLVDNFPERYSTSYGCHEIRHHEDGIGAIPPHSDRGHYCGITIFLNRRWDREWGGWNYTFESDNIKITEPKFNRAVILLAPNLHGCTHVWERDKVRRSMQFFVDDLDDQN